MVVQPRDTRPAQAHNRGVREPSERGIAVKRSLLISVVVVIVLLGLAATACESDSNESDGTTPTGAETPDAAATTEVTAEDSGEGGEDGGASYSEDDPEYQLAVIEAGGFVPLDDPSIDTYAILLDSLGAKCSEERSLIGDQAVVAAQLLAEEGIAVSALEALQGIDGSIPEGSPVLSCAEVGAAWIALVVAQ